MSDGVTDVVVDYAEPLMKIEKLAKQIHYLCLEHEYETARTKAQELCVEGKLLQSVLVLMQENKR
jgi:hypothetical protein